jgi:acyl-CoA reductase-like NAD-dependent aldehyde dehydrogenase
MIFSYTSWALTPTGQGAAGGPAAGHSYGGYKQSGIGKEYSLEAMPDSYTLTKNVVVNLQGGPKYS